MAARFKAPRGTFDVLPSDSAARARVYDAAARAFERAGYGRIETPVFEETELFARGVGESTDIVQKEMFTFEDQGGRSLTLRPEATASICRAYVEHGMHKLPQPVKLWCWGPFFRHERPQSGRYRQFHQIDSEVIGTDSPLADAESIILLSDLLPELAVPGVELRLGSLGSLETRKAYREELRALPQQHEASLSDDVRSRIDSNPLRAFDSDHEGTQRGDGERADDARPPRLRGRRALRGRQARRSSDAGVEYVLDGTLVRGLDYYTRTVFEFTSDVARRAIGAGRRRPLRRPGRGARRSRDARRRLGGGHRAHPAGARRDRAKSRRSTPSSSRPTASASARSASRPRRGEPAPAWTSTWPAARRRAR